MNKRLQQIRRKKKIAFCFLLYDRVNHRRIWEEFFSQDSVVGKSHSIYSHLKKVTDKTPYWIRENKIKSIKTGWCQDNLVYAWINMLKAALENKDNKYFVLLSGECIPLFTFNEIYRKITSSRKSRINIDADATITDEIGLYYADQWVTLNRKCAELLVELRTTDLGRKRAKEMNQEICGNFESNTSDGEECYCPDEIFPVNWLVFKLAGEDGTKSSPQYMKEVRDLPTTYTYWAKSGHPHPLKFNLTKMWEMRQKICESKALFGRKFYKRAARALGMRCGSYDSYKEFVERKKPLSKSRTGHKYKRGRHKAKAT